MALTASGTMTITTARWWRWTGKADAYYTDYRGTAQEFVSALNTAIFTRGSGICGRKSAAARPRFK